MRNIKFQTGEYYHIYNRGVDKRNLFMDKNDYLRFLKNMKNFNETETRSLIPETGSQLTPKLVEFICYCLNPNHYHFLLEQLVDKGIEKFMHKLGVGYVMYFNQKYNRSGYLFEGRYKSIHIQDDFYFFWLSGYINGNSEIHKIAEAKKYQLSSYLEYLGKTNNQICNSKKILNRFKNIKEYQNFVQVVIKEAKTRKKIDKYILE